jgi:hypothetical protein
LKLLEDDIIQVYGVFMGTGTITYALTGTDAEVPIIYMEYVDLLDG